MQRKASLSLSVNANDKIRSPFSQVPLKCGNFNGTNFMKKKASLSLSVNAIVVLILAIVMLSLALGFIKILFGKTSAQVEAIASKEP